MLVSDCSRGYFTASHLSAFLDLRDVEYCYSSSSTVLEAQNGYFAFDIDLQNTLCLVGTYATILALQTRYTA